MKGPPDSYFKHVLLHRCFTVFLWIIILMADVKILQDKKGVFLKETLFHKAITLRFASFVQFSLWFQQSCCFT